jgi:hypothetical protein
MDVTRDQIAWYRLRRSGLIEPFSTPEECANALFGTQAQIHTAGGLALWNRCGKGLSLEEYERQLYDDRTLVKLWGQRGTLHVYDAQDWSLVIGSRGNGPTWSERSLVKQGGDVNKFHAIIDRIRKIAEREGTISRSRLRAEETIDWDVGVDEDLLSSWGGLFSQPVVDGTLCHIRPQGGEGKFAHRSHWLPDLQWDPPTFQEADIELARRFLHTFGPSTVREYAYWRGITQTRAKAGIEGLGAEVVQVVCGKGELLILRDDIGELSETPPPRAMWPVKLLYRFDPFLLGHKDKSWLVDMKFYDRVWIAAGHINGTILAGGKLQGTWNYKRKGSGKRIGSGGGTGARLNVEVRPFRKFGKGLVRKVEKEAKGVAGFFGVELGQVTWVE